MIKVDASRSVEWSHAYLGFKGRTIFAADTEDGYTAAITAIDDRSSNVPDREGAYLLRVDKSGEYLWGRGYEPKTNGDAPRALVAATRFPDGHLAMVLGLGDAVVTDPNGKIVEQRSAADYLRADFMQRLYEAGSNRLSIAAAGDSCLVMAGIFDGPIPTWACRPEAPPIVNMKASFGPREPKGDSGPIGTYIESPKGTEGLPRFREHRGCLAAEHER